MDFFSRIDALTDEELVGKAVKDADRHFPEIMNRWQGPIFAYAFRMLGDRDDAMDATQSAFIKAYRNLAGFDRKRKFSSWLYRIAHNEIVNHVKKFRKPEASLDQDNGLANLLASDSSPEGDYRAEEARLLTNRILARLRPKYREVLVLRYLEEKSYEEIARILGKPKNTVGTLLNRAKKQLGSMDADSVNPLRRA